MRRVAACQHGGCANETEVPADAQEDERHKEMFQINAHKRHSASTCEDQQAKCHDLFRAMACDQVTSEEARYIHRQNMGCDNIACDKLELITHGSCGHNAFNPSGDLCFAANTTADDGQRC